MDILYVEDSPTTAASLTLEMELIAPRYKVTVKGTLREALETIQQEEFDLILLDLGLPDSEGIATFEAIDQATKAPIIILSALNEESVIRETLRKGARNYLLKGTVDTQAIANVCQRVKGEENIQKVLMAYDRAADAAREQKHIWEKLVWEVEKAVAKEHG